MILPAPHAIAVSLYQDRALLWSNLLVTVEEVLLGMLLGMIAAFALSVLIHFSRTLRRALYPLLISSQTVPIPMIAPVLVLWLGFGLRSEGPDRRARRVLPGRRHDLHRARRASMVSCSS